MWLAAVLCLQTVLISHVVVCLYVVVVVVCLSVLFVSLTIATITSRPLPQEQELAENRSAIDIPSLERSLQTLADEKKKLDQKVSSLQQELGRVSQQSSARGALESLRRDKRSREEQYQNEYVASLSRGGVFCHSDVDHILVYLFPQDV